MSCFLPFLTCCLLTTLLFLLSWERPQVPFVSKHEPQAIFSGQEDYHPLLIHIPSGHFIIESLASLHIEPEKEDTPHPKKVHIPYDFLIMSTELNTRIAYQLKKRSDYTSSSCMGDCPAINVSWFDAIELANLLSQAVGLEPCYTIQGKQVLWHKGVACLGYRLPLEEEWEYAAKAGLSTIADKGKADLLKEAWFRDNSVQGTHPIASKLPTSIGLYDVHGNAAEWCWDVWDKVNNPMGTQRATRGGAWNSKPEQVQLGTRSAMEQSTRNPNTGVRFVRTLPSFNRD